MELYQHFTTKLIELDSVKAALQNLIVSDFGDTLKKEYISGSASLSTCVKQSGNHYWIDTKCDFRRAETLKAIREILERNKVTSGRCFYNNLISACRVSADKNKKISSDAAKGMAVIREELRLEGKPKDSNYRQGWQQGCSNLNTEVPAFPDKLPKYKELLNAEFPDGICEFLRQVNYDLYCDFQETVLSALRSVERQIILIIRRSLIPRVLDKRSAFRSIVKFLFKNLDDEHSSVNNILNTLGNYLKQNLHEKEKYSRHHIRYPADTGFQRFSFT